MGLPPVFDESANPAPKAPGIDADGFTRLIYLDKEGHTLLESRLYVGTNGDIPDTHDVAMQMVRDVTFRQMTREQALDICMIQIPDLHNSHFSRHLLEDYAGVKLFPMYMNIMLDPEGATVAEKSKFGVCMEIFPKGYEDYCQRLNTDAAPTPPT